MDIIDWLGEVCYCTNSNRGGEIAKITQIISNFSGIYGGFTCFDKKKYVDDLISGLDATYAAKTEAIKAISFSGRTVTLTKTDNTTSTVANTYALYSEVWDSNGHLVSPAGWVFYITNDAYNA